MRDPARIDPTLAAIGAYWHEHPDLRLGQILSNVVYMTPKDVFYIEDEDLIAALGYLGSKNS